MDVDALTLQFSPVGQQILQVALGLVMFGVALDLTPADFRQLARDPKAPLIGLVTQFLLLPPLATALAVLVAPTPSMALGLLLVASCPGGNVSNFLTQLAGGRVSVSVGMTAVSTLAAIVATPLNVALYAPWLPGASDLLRALSLNPTDVAFSVALLLGVPVLLGMGLRHLRPALAQRLMGPMRTLSLVVFVAIVLGAMGANLGLFAQALPVVFLPVLVVNAAALLLGWGMARLVGLPAADRRAVSLEVGIQNAGLGLALVFSAFDGLGGMALVAGWWGIWHLLSGMALADAWRRWIPLAPEPSP